MAQHSNKVVGDGLVFGGPSCWICDAPKGLDGAAAIAQQVNDKTLRSLGSEVGGEVPLCSQKAGRIRIFKAKFSMVEAEHRPHFLRVQVAPVKASSNALSLPAAMKVVSSSCGSC